MTSSILDADQYVFFEDLKNPSLSQHLMKELITNQPLI